MKLPFIGPSYDLDSRVSGVQRTVNMFPIPVEPGDERTAWVFKDAPGLEVFSTEADGEALVTWDPSYVTGPYVFSNGNLTLTETSDVDQMWTRATRSVSTGKYYWQIVISSTGDTDHCDQFIGIRRSDTPAATNVVLGNTCLVRTQGNVPGSAWLAYVGSSGATLTTSFYTGLDVDNAVMQFAFDATLGRLWVGIIGTGTGWFGSGADPATNTNPVIYDIPAGDWFPFIGVDNDDGDNTSTARFSTADWSIAAPSGFISVGFGS